MLLTILLPTVDWSPLQLAVLLAALQFVGEVFVLRNYSIAQVLMMPVALRLVQFVATKPALELIAERMWRQPSVPRSRFSSSG